MGAINGILMGVYAVVPVGQIGVRSITDGHLGRNL